MVVCRLPNSGCRQPAGGIRKSRRASQRRQPAGRARSGVQPPVAMLVLLTRAAGAWLVTAHLALLAHESSYAAPAFGHGTRLLLVHPQTAGIGVLELHVGALTPLLLY